jgi:hypothetical protein
VTGKARQWLQDKIDPEGVAAFLIFLIMFGCFVVAPFLRSMGWL